jgi:hypothetical protein
MNPIRLPRPLLAITLALGALVAPRAARAARPFSLQIEGEAGARTVDLQTFRANEDSLSAGLFPTRATGPTLGVGAEARVLIFTAGLGTNVSFLQGGGGVQDPGADGFRLWNVDADLGVRVPMLFLEPHVSLGAGYSTLGGWSDAIAGLERGLDVDGANLHALVGVDLALGTHLVLGLGVQGHLLFLGRQGMPLRDLLTPKEIGTIGEARQRVLEADGTSVGGSLGLMMDLGLRI